LLEGLVENVIWVVGEGFAESVRIPSYGGRELLKKKPSYYI